MSLSWAVIPTAGRGTRLAPATDAVPKVLLPVGLRPMLDWAVDEALDAGVAHIAVIVAGTDELVRRYLRQRAKGPTWRPGVALHFVEQPTPAGLGDALMRCRPLTGDDDLGVVVPDNWFDAQVPPLLQIAATRQRTGLSAIGLVEVGPRQGALLGNVGRVELEPLGGPDFRIRRLGDKQPGSFRVEGSGAVPRGCARYVLGPEFYEALSATGPPEAGEWDDVPAFQQLARTQRLAGCRLSGRHFDVGHAAGYLAAMSYLFERDVSGSGA
jgi:UTP--glucose-1-phosphate uridylyltransferase